VTRPPFMVGDICEVLGHRFEVVRVDTEGHAIEMRRMYVTGEVDRVSDVVRLSTVGMVQAPAEGVGPLPTGAPAPCVWRWHDDNDTYYSSCANTAKHDQPTMGWKVCPYCKGPFQIGHPLTVER
jgi:hypothetical protein